MSKNTTISITKEARDALKSHSKEIGANYSDTILALLGGLGGHTEPSERDPKMVELLDQWARGAEKIDLIHKLGHEKFRELWSAAMSQGLMKEVQQGETRVRVVTPLGQEYAGIY